MSSKSLMSLRLTLLEKTKLLLAVASVLLSLEVAIAQDEPPRWALGDFPRGPGERIVPDVAGITFGMSLKEAMRKLEKYNKDMFYQQRTFQELASGIKGKFVTGLVVARDGSYELSTPKGCRQGEPWERFRKPPVRLCWDSVHESVYILVSGLPGKEYVTGVELVRSYTENGIDPVEDAPTVLETRNALLSKYGYPTFYSDGDSGGSVHIGYAYKPDGTTYHGEGGQVLQFPIPMDIMPPRCIAWMDYANFSNIFPGPGTEEGCGLSVYAWTELSPKLNWGNLAQAQILKASVFMFDFNKWAQARKERLAAIEKSEGRQKVRKKDRRKGGF